MGSDINRGSRCTGLKDRRLGDKKFRYRRLTERTWETIILYD